MEEGHAAPSAFGVPKFMCASNVLRRRIAPADLNRKIGHAQNSLLATDVAWFRRFGMFETYGLKKARLATMGPPAPL